MNTKKKSVPKFFRIFDITKFPHDLARFLLLPLQLGYRVRKYDCNGKKYKKILKGAALVACNHVSFNDPFIILCVFWYRRLSMLVAEVVMKTPVRNFFMRGMGCIRIDRTISDLDAVRDTLDVLSKGRPVLVFPQGRIHRDGGADDMKSGSILMALQANVPIIPAYTYKRKHWYNRTIVVFGEPIDCASFCAKKMPSMTEINTITEELHQRILKCKSTYERITGEKI